MTIDKEARNAAADAAIVANKAKKSIKGKQAKNISVGSQSAMLALTNVSPGQVVIREDDGYYNYLLKSLPASNLSNWQPMGKDASPVGETVSDIIATNENLGTKQDGLYAIAGVPLGGLPSGVNLGDVVQKTGLVYTIAYTFANAPATIYSNSDQKTYNKKTNGAGNPTWEATPIPTTYPCGVGFLYSTLQAAIDAYTADFIAGVATLGIIDLWNSSYNENVTILATVQNLHIRGIGTKYRANTQVSRINILGHRVTLQNIQLTNITQTPLVINSSGTITESGTPNVGRGKHVLDQITFSTSQTNAIDVQACDNFLIFNNCDFDSKVINIGNKTGTATSITIDGCNNGILNLGNNRVATKNNSLSVYRGTISSTGTLLLDVDAATPIAYSILRSYSALGASVPVVLGTLIINDDVGGGLQNLKCKTAYTIAANLGVGTAIDLTKYDVQASGSSITVGAVQTANFTAVKNTIYPVNTTSGAIVATLPATPTAGDVIRFIDYANKFGTNKLTINPNGLKINSSTSSVDITSNNADPEIIYIDSAEGWALRATSANSSGGGASTIGDFGLFSSLLPPTTGFLRQNTGPYNIADYPTLGAAFTTQTFTTTVNYGTVHSGSGGMYSMRYTGTKYIATVYNGDLSNIKQSTDGINWSNLPVTNLGNNWNAAITDGAGKIALLPYNGTQSTKALYSTNDGASWSIAQLPASITNGFFETAVAFGNGRMVAINQSGSNCVTIISTDYGATWTTGTGALPAAQAFTRLAWDGTNFVTVDSTGRLYRSPDGNNWVAGASLGAGTYRVYGNPATGRLYITLPGSVISVIWYSTDSGQTYTNHQLPASRSWLQMAFGPSMIFAVGSDNVSISSVYYSVDNGVSWVNANNYTTPVLYTWGLATNGAGTFVTGYGASPWSCQRIVLTKSTTFTVPALAEPSGFQYWVKATSDGSSGMTLGAVQTANFTAVANYEYPINTTSGAVTMTMPASPTAGQRVGFLDYANKFDANNLTLNPNGSKFAGNTSNVTISTKGTSAIMLYVDSTQGWVPETYSVWGSLFSVALAGDSLTASVLTTSLTAFNAAGANSVVEITQAEYNLLKAISNTTIMAASDAIMTGATAGGTNGGNYVTGYSIPLTSGGKIVGFSLGKATTGAGTFDIYTTSNPAIGGTANKIYTTPLISASKFYYFVIKTPTALGNNLFLATNNSISGDLISSATTNYGTGAFVNSANNTVTFTNQYDGQKYPLIQLLNRTT